MKTTTNNLQVTPMAIEVYARGMETMLKLVASDIKGSYSDEDDLVDHYQDLKEATDFGIAMIQSYARVLNSEKHPAKKKALSFLNDEEE